MRLCVLSALPARYFLLLGAAVAAKPEFYPPRGLLYPSDWEQHRVQILAIVFWSLFLLAMLVVMVCRRRAKPVAPSLPAVAARDGLAALRDRAESREVYQAVSQLIRRYVLTVKGLGELTTEELTKELRRDPLGNAELSRQVTELLRECDASKFSATPPALATNLVARASAWLEQTEAQLNHREPTPPAPAPAA